VDRKAPSLPAMKFIVVGDLFTQGREIAVFKASDPTGLLANSPSAFGVQPYKGNIFFSDMHSGLWAVRLRPTRPVS
jgi:hypothetical protein